MVRENMIGSSKESNRGPDPIWELLWWRHPSLMPWLGTRSAPTGTRTLSLSPPETRHRFCSHCIYPPWHKAFGSPHILPTEVLEKASVWCPQLSVGGGLCLLKWRLPKCRRGLDPGYLPRREPDVQCSWGRAPNALDTLSPPAPPNCTDIRAPKCMIWAPVPTESLVRTTPPASNCGPTFLKTKSYSKWASSSCPSSPPLKHLLKSVSGGTISSV